MSEQKEEPRLLDVAIIIVSWNVREYLADCLRSVYNDITKSQLRCETWVVRRVGRRGRVEAEVGQDLEAAGRKAASF